MANEISITANLTATKGTSKVSRSATFSANWSVARKDSLTQVIGTTAEALSIGADIATNGWVHATNNDASNYVEIGRDNAGTFMPLIRLNAGESTVFRLAQGITPWARANTASVDMEWNLLND